MNERRTTSEFLSEIEEERIADLLVNFPKEKEEEYAELLDRINDIQLDIIKKKLSEEEQKYLEEYLDSFLDMMAFQNKYLYEMGYIDGVKSVRRLLKL